MGCEDDDDEDGEEDEWEEDDQDDFDDFDGYEEDEWGEEDGAGRRKSKPGRLANRSLSRRRGTRRSPRRKKKLSGAVAAATVRMRHPASGTSLSWRTAGVKDTSGAELHEGASYRLVATVKEAVPPAGAAGGAAGVEVTRCRLTLVTPDAGGR